MILLLGAVAVLAARAAAANTCECPTPTTVTGFQPDKYLGKWYEMRRVDRGFERGGTCSTAEYSWTDSTNKTVNVVNTNYIPSIDAGYVANLLATPVSLTDGKFSVSQPSQPTNPPSPYWVLGTDYEKYSVVYSCSKPSDADCANVNSGKSVPAITVWVLARDWKEYESSSTLQDTVNNLLKKNGVDDLSFVDVVHHTCPSTSCSECPGKANLDLNKFKGRWRELQHSPYATGSDRQSCGVFDFLATQDGVKINGSMVETSGDQATEGTTDFSGKWTDTSTKAGEFTITSFSGVQKNDPNDRMCIIDTDYDNWAVVTVCVKNPDTSSLPPQPPGFAKATIGGVWVMGRREGLSADDQMKANKALLTAGVLPHVMQATAPTPCPVAAFYTGAAGAATATLAVTVGALAALRLA